MHVQGLVRVLGKIGPDFLVKLFIDVVVQVKIKGANSVCELTQLVERSSQFPERVGDVAEIVVHVGVPDFFDPDCRCFEPDGEIVVHVEVAQLTGMVQFMENRDSDGLVPVLAEVVSRDLLCQGNGRFDVGALWIVLHAFPFARHMRVLEIVVD